MIPMLFSTRHLDSEALDANKQAALEHMLDAWQDAVQEGIDPAVVASAAMFTALSDLIDLYGEEPVAKMVQGLKDRIRRGEFTLNRTTQ
ncbi:MAG: hypothetical protein ACTSUY_09125 [Alphaproteobacteria bacterium]